jgi:Protein-glutamine gamma-glutamyltransferase
MPNNQDVELVPGGILIRAATADDLASAKQSFLDQAMKLGIDQLIETFDERDAPAIRFRLRSAVQHELAPAWNTLQLCEKLNLLTLESRIDLEKEILLAMLLGPVTFEYPSYAELAASVRIRQNIVEAARHTALSFHTHKIERPTDYWTYSRDTGFTVLPGKSLIEALRKATQPEVSGQLYAFSCYRASEYVVLLGIAQELANSNPELLHRLQRQWESEAIVSEQFQGIFLREYGSMSRPLPPKYYVPGDRLWFRNPHEPSSDVTGYEGSWVFYLGNGLFNNFWKCDSPYNMIEKCVEIFHWRSGMFKDAEGKLQMDESIVEERSRATLKDPAELEQVLDCILRLRDAFGVYANGGCIDTTREYPRWVCPGTSDIVLPDK